MRLDAPAFSLRLDMDKALTTLKSRMKKKHWHSFKAGTIKLVYLPFYIFNYTVYEKAPKDQGGAITGEKTGRKAMNANTIQFLDIIPYIMDEEPVTMEESVSHQYEIDVLAPTVSEKEARKVAPPRLAAQFKVPEDAVIVTGLSLVYLPVWRIWTTIAEGTFRLDVDAVLGTIINEEQVPSRERGIEEVSMETLKDLTVPANWPKYAKTSAEFLAEKMGGKKASVGMGGLIQKITGGNPMTTVLLVIVVILLLILLFQTIFGSAGTQAAEAGSTLVGAEVIIP